MQKIYLSLLLFTLTIQQSICQNQSKPNVLVILADDLGSLDLNCYGSKDLETPNLDKLAKSGVRFTQFYAAAPVCSPSRAALLTGKSNLGAGLPGNVPIPEGDPEGKAGLPTEEVTMAEYFKEAGYSTALVGKWHLGHHKDKVPNSQGFDYFFGHQRGCIDNYSHFFFWAGPNKHDLYRNNEEVLYPGEYFPDLMVDEVSQIITKDENPFFVYWAINVPHYPYQATPKWLEHYKDLPSPRKEYAAFVSTMDERVGEVLNELEKAGKKDNTIIVFQSDHGHSCEERAFGGGGNAGPYRGCKFSMFEGGLRVPAIISYPDKLPANEVRDQLCSEMDWLPTIAELSNIKLTDNKIEGKSLMPIIKSKKAATQHEIINWQVGGYDDAKNSWAVREGDWKLLGHPNDPSTKTKFTEKDELYLVNLKDDIGEQKNVAESNPKIVAKLKKYHEDWLSKIKSDRNID
ncbi:MAG: sulfatase [Thalassobius sp.]|nr:sulfatase [Thalassovita sp.]